MAFIFLQAKDPASGRVVGYRAHSKVLFDGKKATSYLNPSSARVGLSTARRNWPQYSWAAVDKNGEVVDIGPVLQMKFTREEVWALVLKERYAWWREVNHNMLESRPKTLKDLECEAKPSTP